MSTEQRDGVTTLADDPIVCECCGHLDFRRAPRLKEAADYVASRREFTSHEVADAIGVSIAAACNTIGRLRRLGLVRVTRVDNLPAGGVEYVYEPVATPDGAA